MLTLMYACTYIHARHKFMLVINKYLTCQALSSDFSKQHQANNN